MKMISAAALIFILASEQSNVDAKLESDAGKSPSLWMGTVLKGIKLEHMGWQFDGYNGDYTIAIYLKPLARKSSAALPQQWVRHEFSDAVSQTPYRSSAALWEYRCSQKKKRSLDSIFYAENNFKGEVVYRQSEPREWDDWRPGTFEDGEWGKVCGREPAPQFRGPR
jgi:hypothetical protein